MKLSRDFLCTQRIPEDFDTIYCKNMLNPVYLEVPSGEVWEVEVKHYQGQTWLAKGWKDFTDYYSISSGYFLIFRYNNRSHFNVTIFELSAAEIEYPYSSHTFYCHETHHAPERDQSESDDSVDILEDTPRSQKVKEKLPNMVEHSVENRGHVPIGQSSKRKIQQGDADDDLSVEKLQEGQTGNTLMHNIVGVPGGSDSVSKVIKTDNSVPFSQPMVVHTENLKQPSESSYGFNLKIKEEHGEGTEIKHSAEILGQYSSGQRSKRKRLEGYAEDDASIDIHTKSIKVESLFFAFFHEEEQK
ncbi:hypothetical protein K7X08_017308 [Anisodus acutangulus]|uniref:TF-B3 domain-containing protein n=1 Tax=Anisodus acutangulus TaxID=402998 RepID=A0A9Q1R826_9SOLA|nr:hypothetical protein K7X08_017308 [Anisodus acutangulus]